MDDKLPLTSVEHKVGSDYEWSKPIKLLDVSKYATPTINVPTLLAWVQAAMDTAEFKQYREFSYSRIPGIPVGVMTVNENPYWLLEEKVFHWGFLQLTAGLELPEMQKKPPATPEGTAGGEGEKAAWLEAN